MGTVFFDSIIAIALAVINRDKGIKRLSLRAIAREAGCSHVNLYHYFADLQALLWHVYCRALNEYRDFCVTAMQSRGSGDSIMSAFAKASVDFANHNEGWYRLIWLEELDSQPPPFVLEAIGRISGEYDAFAAAAFDGTAASEKADIYLSWLQGKISILVSGRNLGDRSQAERSIIKSAASLEKLLSGYR